MVVGGVNSRFVEGRQAVGLVSLFEYHADLLFGHELYHAGGRIFHHAGRYPDAEFANLGFFRLVRQLPGRLRCLHVQGSGGTRHLEVGLKRPLLTSPPTRYNVPDVPSSTVWESLPFWS